MTPESRDLLHRWEDQLRAVRGLDGKTVEVYRQAVSSYLGFMAQHLGGQLGRRTLGEVSVRDFRSWMAAERNEGVGSRTLAKKLSALRNFHEWLEEAEGVTCPAIHAVQSPRLPARLPRPVGAEDAQAILETVSTHRVPWVAARDRAALTLIWGAGLRVSEALGLRWKHAPLGEILRITGKGGKQREVPLLPVSRDAVEAYRNLCPHAPDPDGALFLGVRGGALGRREISVAMAEARVALGLPASATPHALRHSFATQLLAAGGDLRAIQKLLGHANLSSTQIYTGLDETRILDVYQSAHPRSGKVEDEAGA